MSEVSYERGGTDPDQGAVAVLSQPVAAAGAAAEPRRRVGTVTLLFTDQVASTEMMERLGDDVAEDLRRTHFRMLREAVRARGGQEVKNMGDGLMVVFDSACDALGCAVAMQQLVHLHNRRRPDHAFHIRVGLHVGEPIRHEEDYFGSAVVVAKRLCEGTTGGHIVASQLVAALVGRRDGHTFTDLGMLDLKGFAQPFAACEVTWEALGREPMPLPPALRSPRAMPFVGRGDEIARLGAAWERACHASPQAVLIAGEPGIGKTRLATEFALQAHAAGAIVLYGRADEDPLVPYQPFEEALRYSISASRHNEMLARLPSLGGALSRLVPELAERSGNCASADGTNPQGSADAERHRLFEAVTTLVSGAADCAPVLLVLDDLQWADRSTLLLVRYLLRSIGEARLMVVGTYCDIEVDRRHPFSQLVADLVRDVACERITVGGLSHGDVVTLLEKLGERELSDLGYAVATVLYRQTEGNPLYIRARIRQLTERGLIHNRDGKWKVDGSATVADELPERIRQVVGRRLSRLDDECMRVLGAASVIGVEFDLDTLGNLSGTSEDDLVEILEQAVAVRVIAEVQDRVGHYRFAQQCIRQTIHDELSETRRSRLSARLQEQGDMALVGASNVLRQPLRWELETRAS